MKTKILSSVCCLLAFTALSSCDDAGDRLVVEGFTDPVITASSTTVVVTEDQEDAVVLILSWTYGELSLSDPSIEITDDFYTFTLQISDGQDFADPRERSATGTSVTYTGSQLSTLAGQFGIAAGETGVLYFRVEAKLGENTKRYSEPVAVSVTPADISLDLLWMVPDDGSFTDFSFWLSSNDKDGVYTGFRYVPGWYNFRFYAVEDASAPENDIYGSDPADLYKLNNTTDRWNIWFDQNDDAYIFITADLSNMIWSFREVEWITVVGDFNGWDESATPLTYDKAEDIWTVETDINDISWGLKFMINKDWGWCYTDTDGNGLLEPADDPNIIPEEGTGRYRITLDLRDSANLKYTFEKL